MSANELLQQARFVVDMNGERTEVVLDIEVWEQLLRELGLAGNGSQEEWEILDPSKNPLLEFIGVVSIEGLADNIDEELYGR